jgi:hypothetical protein
MTTRFGQLSDSFSRGISVETPAQHKQHLRDNEHKYRHFFRDYDSYEIFMMLPVSEEHRHKLLAVLQKEREEEEKTRMAYVAAMLAQGDQNTSEDCNTNDEGDEGECEEDIDYHPEFVTS